MVSPKDYRAAIDPRALAEDFQRQLTLAEAGDLPGVSQELLKAAIEQLSTLAPLPDAGREETLPTDSKPTLPFDLLEEISIPKDSSTSRLDLGDREIVPISAMNPEALLRETRVGSISPPVTGRLFVSDDLRTPVPSGFIFGPSIVERDPAPRAYAPLDRDTGALETSISIPSGSLHQNILPIPIDCAPAFAPESLTVAPPTPDAPFTWRGRFKRGSTVEFTITQGTIPALSAEEQIAVAPSQAEMAWIREHLPLPPSLRSKLEAASLNKDTEEVFELVTLYMQGKDPRTGLSNFRYVNHKAFGEFIQEHSEELLPLIVSSLKVGHCDLLAWYGATLLRGYGVTAWVTSEICPTSDGKAFNGAYGHARIVFSSGDGTLTTWDPTTQCDEDIAYAPEHLSAQTVVSLSNEIYRASSSSARWEVLEGFRARMDQSRQSLPAESGTKERSGVLSLIGSIELTTEIAPLGAESGTRSGATIDRSAQLNTPDRVIDLLRSLETSEGLLRVERLSNLPSVVLPGRPRTQLNEALASLKKLRIPCSIGALSHDEIGKHLPFWLGGRWKDTDFFRDGISIRVESTNPFRAPGAVPRYPLLPSEAGWEWIGDELLSKDIRFQLGEYSLKSIGAGSTLGYGAKAAKVTERSPALNDLLKRELLPVLLSTTYQFSVNFAADGTPAYQEYEVAPRDLFTVARQSLRLWLQVQDALTTPQARSTLCTSLGISEGKFWKLAATLSQIDTMGRRPEGSLQNGKETGYRRAMEVASLDTECSGAFRRGISDALRHLNHLASKAPRMELEDLRLYNFGDDTRRINWKVFAKTDRFYVAGSPINAQAQASPLYVVLDGAIRPGRSDDGNLHSRYQALEVVDLLRKDPRRRIYLASEAGPWVELTPKMRGLSPGEILDRLPGGPPVSYDTPTSIRLPNGALPPNLLFVSTHFLRCLAHHTIYSSPSCRVVPVWLNDPSLHVWPQIKEKWTKREL